MFAVWAHRPINRRFIIIVDSSIIDYFGVQSIKLPIVQMLLVQLGASGCARSRQLSDVPRGSARGKENTRYLSQPGADLSGEWPRSVCNYTINTLGGGALTNSRVACYLAR